jgi:hypothetical protein
MPTIPTVLFNDGTEIRPGILFVDSSVDLSIAAPSPYRFVYKVKKVTPKRVYYYRWNLETNAMHGFGYEQYDTHRAMKWYKPYKKPEKERIGFAKFVRRYENG